ncbi:hypothetical protein [Streptomyces sp. NPDC058623]|uniref:hypothetical protein n=1 Tax=Streptomyces sp. NPDC058623 TaxID=3346563 RepID=UPI0036642496
MRDGTGVMGSGYGRHSAAQHVGIGIALDMLDRAVAALPLPDDGRALRVADLGCASGGNALEPMARVVAGARDRAPGIAVAVTHTDIRGNDFNALVETLATPDAYTREPGVFAYAEARSFFSPLFPPGELHLAWSSIAVHWLSYVPRPIPEHVYCSGATGAVREALRERSAADWRAFLHHRAVELAPGGRLVVVGGAATDDGASGAEGLFGMVVEELRARVREGRLDADRFATMTVPTEPHVRRVPGHAAGRSRARLVPVGGGRLRRTAGSAARPVRARRRPRRVRAGGDGLLHGRVRPVPVRDVRSGGRRRRSGRRGRRAAPGVPVRPHGPGSGPPGGRPHELAGAVAPRGPDGHPLARVATGSGTGPAIPDRGGTGPAASVGVRLVPRPLLACRP